MPGHKGTGPPEEKEPATAAGSQVPGTRHVGRLGMAAEAQEKELGAGPGAQVVGAPSS